MDAAIRPWRTATLVASAIALAELAALVVAGLLLVGGPLARRVHERVAAKAAAPAVHLRPVRVVPPPAVPRLTRARMHVLVLNGNGRAGAASTEAVRLQTLGYPRITTGNAPHARRAASLVMYRPGYRPEAVRMAHDLGVRLVGPLDGLRVADLRGAQVVEILGT
jgi:LytR cell envelope-related transcriptional attenuator